MNETAMPPQPGFLDALAEPEHPALHAGMLDGLIQTFRNGSPVLLVCQVAVEGFSPGNVYPVRKVARGCGFEVLDDDGDVITLDGEYPDLDSFVVSRSEEEATEIVCAMKQEAVGRLGQRAYNFMNTQRFAVGDLVEWKPGMRVSMFPLYGQPAMVMEVLPEPVTDTSLPLLDPTRTLRCDLVIGMETTEGQFITLLADSRRFTMHLYQISANLPNLQGNSSPSETDKD